MSSLLKVAHEDKPYSAEHLDFTELQPSFRVDLRRYSEQEYNKFVTMNTVSDWSSLSWKDAGRPYEVKANSKDRDLYEQEFGKSMSVHTSWQYFNRAFHEWFVKDVPTEQQEKKEAFKKSLVSFNPKAIKAALGDVARIQLWNYAHRIGDGVWDPRGKRALFEGLDVKKPRILFLVAISKCITVWLPKLDNI